MSIKHHFTKEQARQFCEKFGTDWHWSYSTDERDLSAQEMGKINRYFPRLRGKGMELSSSPNPQPGTTHSSSPEAQGRTSGLFTGRTEMKVNTLS